MDRPTDISNDQLLDYVLERCQAADEQRIRAALRQDPALNARCDRLRRRLAPLDAWTAPPPREGLVDDILDVIAAQSAGRALERRQAASALPPGSNRDLAGSRPLVSLRELVALAACITFLVGIVVPGLSTARFNSRRTMCASNLAGLYQGMSSYAQSYAGLLPMVGREPGQPWLRKQDQAHRTNRSNAYLLLRHRFVARPEQFVCQARKGARPMSTDQIDRNTDFPSDRNCSYDLQNLSGPTPRHLLIAARIALPFMADANPLFEGGRFNGAADPQANTTSHQGLGQNVLHFDGRVAWYVTPLSESTRDNIWQAGDLREYNGTETPLSTTDAFLTP